MAIAHQIEQDFTLIPQSGSIDNRFLEHFGVSPESKPKELDIGLMAIEVTSYNAGRAWQIGTRCVRAEKIEDYLVHSNEGQLCGIGWVYDEEQADSIPPSKALDEAESLIRETGLWVPGNILELKSTYHAVSGLLLVGCKR